MPYSLVLDWESGQPTEFSTLGALSEWVSKEAALWDEFFSGANPPPGANSLNLQKKAFGRLRQLVETTNQQPIEAQEAHFTTAKKAVESFFRDQGCVVSNSRTGAALLALGEAVLDANLRAIHLQLAVGRDLQLSTAQGPFAAGGIFRGIWLQLYGGGSPEAQQNLYLDQRSAELRGLAGELSESLASNREQLSMISADAAKNLSSLESAAGEARATMDSTIATANSKIAEQIADTQAAITDLKSYYDEELKLRSAVQYWHATARRSLIWATGAGVVFLAIAAWMLFHWSAPIEQMSEAVSAAQQMKLEGANQVIYWVTAGLYSAVPVLVAIWVARLSARLMMRGLVLREDARERETMVLTFLALLKEGAADQEQDRAVILNALFRPAAIPHLDDAAPTSLVDLLSVLRPSVAK